MLSDQGLRRPFIVAFVLLVLPGVIRAQSRPGTEPVRGPILGFVHDATAGIRPVLGIPGAATLGPPVMARGAFEQVAVAADRDYSLAVAARGGQVTMLRNLSTAPTGAALDVPANPARIALSPSGDAAALYYPRTSRVDVLTGLPESPAVAWSSGHIAAGGVAALAVSDGGGAVLLAAAGDPAPLWLASPETWPRVVHTASASPSLAFLSRSEDAVIADALSGEVALLRDLKGEARLIRIGGAADGVSRPVAVAAAPGNRRLFVATTGPAGVVVLPLAGGEPVRLACPCEPAALEPMAGGAVFRLSEPGNGPVWLLDARAASPRIVFVPGQERLPRGAGREITPPRNGGGR